jgi:ribonuclease HI
MDTTDLTASLYTDGGCIGKNPSALGGTWAWCTVEHMGGRLRYRSGHVTPPDVGLDRVTNNYTELLAAVQGLESLPDGWDGDVYTDSIITLYRVQQCLPHWNKAKMKGIPLDLQERLGKVKARLGDYARHLLGGHPTRADLIRGVKPNGMPCSIHNVFCDSLCVEQSRAFFRRLNALRRRDTTVAADAAQQTPTAPLGGPEPQGP